MKVMTLKSFLTGLAVIIVIAVTGLAYAGIQADFSKSYTEVIDSQTIKIRHISNVVQDGVVLPGEFWADFVWDSQSMTLVPTWVVGQEQVPSGKTCAATFTSTYSDDVYDLTLTTDPSHRRIYFLAKVKTGISNVCPTGGSISQGAHSIWLLDSFTSGDWVGSSSWDGCTYEVAGVVKSGILSVP